VINPHLESLGALTLSHHEYMGRLNKAMRVMTPWSTLPFTLDLEAQGDPFAVF
jgi:Leu/Phe-tRNA-protein transferase